MGGEYAPIEVYKCVALQVQETLRQKMGNQHKLKIKKLA